MIDGDEMGGQGMPRRLRGRRDESGAAAVEFALIMPILVLLVLGTIQYGIWFFTSQGGSDIARDAARSSSVGDPASCSAFRDVIRAQIQDLNGHGNDAVISRTYSTAPPGTKVGDVVTVTVSFGALDLHAPMIPVPNAGRVSTRVQSRVEFVPTQPEACP